MLLLMRMVMPAWLFGNSCLGFVVVRPLFGFVDLFARVLWSDGLEGSQWWCISRTISSLRHLVVKHLEVILDMLRFFLSKERRMKVWKWFTVIGTVMSKSHNALTGHAAMSICYKPCLFRITGHGTVGRSSQQSASEEVSGLKVDAPQDFQGSPSLTRLYHHHTRQSVRMGWCFHVSLLSSSPNLFAITVLSNESCLWLFLTVRKPVFSVPGSCAYLQNG